MINKKQKRRFTYAVKVCFRNYKDFSSSRRQIYYKRKDCKNAKRFRKKRKFIYE